MPGTKDGWETRRRLPNGHRAGENRAMLQEQQKSNKLRSADAQRKSAVVRASRLRLRGPCALAMPPPPKLSEGRWGDQPVGPPEVGLQPTRTLAPD